MTTPTTQREADARKALAAITDRLALTYRICCGTSPKQSVGELLDVTIKMPEWEVVRAAIDQGTRQAAPEASALQSLRDGYTGSTMVSDFYGSKITLRYETSAQADAAHAVLCQVIDTRPAAATDQPSAGQVDERARFDARAIAAGFDVSRDTYGEYHSVDLRRYWSGWQWHASLTPTAPQAASQQTGAGRAVIVGGKVDASDKPFYNFWYGHMKGDLMRPPLEEVSHSTARYIWDAAIKSKEQSK